MEIIALANDRDISGTAQAIHLKIEKHCDDYVFNNNFKLRNFILNIDSNDGINVKIHANSCCQWTIAVSQKRHSGFGQNRSSL